MVWWPICNRQSRPLFLDKVANKILAFEEGGVREFFGNYTDYLDEKPSYKSNQPF